MKNTKLTPGANLRWESSRMMLPEHVEALREHKRKSNIQPKPILDDQELQEISNAVYSSFIQKTLISLVLYGQYENRTINGIVRRVDPIRQQIRIDGEWIQQTDIIGYVREDNVYTLLRQIIFLYIITVNQLPLIETNK
jgi:hypothetical protein